MLTLLIFIAVLALLVLSHELGHFIIARRGGVRVEEFGFGFPPRLWSHQAKSGVIYSLNLLPLGGFVKIKGEDALDPSANDADSFQSKSFWRRAGILVAGVAMNILVAFILLTVGFSIGLPQIVDGGSTEHLSDIHVEAIEVLPGKPAAAAGVKPGDAIIKVDNLDNPGLAQLQAYVDAHRNNDIAVTLRRGSTIIVKHIHPIVYPDTNKGGFGISIAEVGLIRYPWYQAIYQSILTTGAYLKEIVLGFALLVRDIVHGAGVGSAVAGPVGVAVLTGQAAKMGLAYLIQFVALLSLNLAVLNILPIPALDGGRLLFLIIGKIIGRPVNAKYEHLFHTVGFVLLIILVAVISFRDVASLRAITQNARGF